MKINAVTSMSAQGDLFGENINELINFGHFAIIITFNVSEFRLHAKGNGGA